MDMKARTGELRCTLTVTRKATGKIETYELVGNATPEQAGAILGDAKRNRVHGSTGALAAQPSDINVQQPESEE